MKSVHVGATKESVFADEMIQNSTNHNEISSKLGILSNCFHNRKQSSKRITNIIDKVTNRNKRFKRKISEVDINLNPTKHKKSMDTSHPNATIEEDWIMNKPVKEQNHQNINDEILRTRNEKTLNDNTKTSYNNHNSPIKHYHSGIPSNPLDHSQEKLVTDLQKIIHDQNEMIKNLNLTIKNLTLRIDELDKKLSHDDINTCATEKKNLSKFDKFTNTEKKSNISERQREYAKIDSEQL
ncbi:hypothetical protein GJ496_003070 [Pomphorhynchus laevis]|nr:hypothetical protein GJ496_003070 [Pomphorhynchus laevis]